MIESARASTALALLLLAGCIAGCTTPAARPLPGTIPAASQAGSPPAAATSPGDEARNEETPVGNAATAVLLADGRSARDDGDYARAAVAVERALSIDPNDAALWIELAEIRNAEGNSEEASTLARKALTLAGADRSIAARADRLTGR